MTKFIKFKDEYKTRVNLNGIRSYYQDHNGDICIEWDHTEDETTLEYNDETQAKKDLKNLDDLLLENDLDQIEEALEALSEDKNF